MFDESNDNYLSIDQFQRGLAPLHQQVCRNRVRVEIRHEHGTCVLISKDELEALEHALDILSNTSDVQKMARIIESLSSTAARGPLLATRRIGAN
jgi:PHD/YefM family antitoxin component YafN of YafNO toxin-antitoxin module